MMVSLILLDGISQGKKFNKLHFLQNPLITSLIQLNYYDNHCSYLFSIQFFFLIIATLT